MDHEGHLTQRGIEYLFDFLQDNKVHELKRNTKINDCNYT